MKQCITQPKKLGMGTQTWGKTYIDFKLRLKKLNIDENTIHDF
jgi:hypothetical protein